MSEKSNNQGRAFEYACLMALLGEINIKSKKLKVSIIKNSSYDAALKAWELVDDELHANLILSAKSIVDTLFEFEPNITAEDEKLVTLKIQEDSQGEIGDVRDIVISKEDICWEIGLSVKHNHFAVKHSRLAKTLDFGAKWFNMPCSNEYWDDVKEIFSFLDKKKVTGADWNDISNKDKKVYVPLLKAFIDEVKRSCKKNKDLPKKMVEYLLGEYDFYKVISVDIKRLTMIQTFNIHGTLNKESKFSKPVAEVPRVTLPTRIVSLDFKPNSTNTLELYMDGGWQFSFRIHNASTKVEPSLKFDIQIVGMPTTIISINCEWSKGN